MYDTAATAYLTAQDPALGEVIKALGKIERTVTPDLFEALANAIVGQQISTAAHATVWQRMTQALGTITPHTLAACTPQALQSLGLSFRKVHYLQSAAQAVLSGTLDLQALPYADDAAVCAQLCALPGVGLWTAEMLLLFSLQRPNVLSYGDFGIRKGLRMVHSCAEISKAQFEAYRSLYTPYGSVASLYLWAVTKGALPHLQDPAPPKQKVRP